MRGAAFNSWIKQALENPAPLLNWTDTNAYKFIDDLSNQPLAWEFLRRCPEYRKDVTEWLPKWQALIGADVPYILEDWLPVRDEMLTLCEKWNLWGVHGLGIPTSHIPPDFKDMQTPRPPEIISISTESEEIELDKDWGKYTPSMTVRIHLDQPLNEQLVYLKKQILSTAKRHGILFPRLGRKDSRRRTGTYALYIQILDARNAGASVREISKTLYREKFTSPEGADDAAQKDMKRATDLSKSDYMDLIRLPPKRGK